MIAELFTPVDQELDEDTDGEHEKHKKGENDATEV